MFVALKYLLKQLGVVNIDLIVGDAIFLIQSNGIGKRNLQNTSIMTGIASLSCNQEKITCFLDFKI